jgi:hypothetical protein
LPGSEDVIALTQASTRSSMGEKAVRLYELPVRASGVCGGGGGAQYLTAIGAMTAPDTRSVRHEQPQRTDHFLQSFKRHHTSNLITTCSNIDFEYHLYAMYILAKALAIIVRCTFWVFPFPLPATLLDRCLSTVIQLFCLPVNSAATPNTKHQRKRTLQCNAGAIYTTQITHPITPKARVNISCCKLISSSCPFSLFCWGPIPESSRRSCLGRA